MPGVAESVSALTLQEADVSSSEELLPSSEEPISASPGTLPLTTINGSLSSFPYNEEDELIAAGAAESASPQTLQEPDVSSSEELLDTALSEELSTASPSSVLHDTADDSPPSDSSSVGPPILFRDPRNWYQEFFMRIDRQGYLHMYPNLGGPFQSLQEAEAAIAHHLNEHRLPEICQKPSEGPLMECLIKQCLYYPDGTPKRCHNSPAHKNPNHQQLQLIKALLDQYNDHHNLCKDLAHELKDLMSFQWIFEDHKAYYHFNFTTKTNKADDVNLFFAEVSRDKSEDAWVLSCCCMIGPDDHGLCYGCCHNGNHKLMHPKNTRAYTGGHVPGCFPYGGDDFSDDDDEDEEAYVARLRFMFKGC